MYYKTHARPRTSTTRGGRSRRARHPETTLPHRPPRPLAAVGLSGGRPQASRRRPPVFRGWLFDSPGSHVTCCCCSFLPTVKKLLRFTKWSVLADKIVGFHDATRHATLRNILSYLSGGRNPRTNAQVSCGVPFLVAHARHVMLRQCKGPTTNSIGTTSSLSSRLHSRRAAPSRKARKATLSGVGLLERSGGNGQRVALLL